MDCPSEENMIRLKIGDHPEVQDLDFDLDNRRLTIFHHRQPDELLQLIASLKLGEELLSSEETEEPYTFEGKDQKKSLQIVFWVNLSFFLIEMTTGLISNSMGLIADSLDMLADASVYGISLLGVNSTLKRKQSIATIAGYLQLGLALLGFAEVIRRFISLREIPNHQTMIVIAALALAANAFCLYVLQKAKGKEEAHMQASLIFTSNDIIINSGVILAGILVTAFQSNLPDLIIGTIVFLVVIRGAFRILRLGR